MNASDNPVFRLDELPPGCAVEIFVDRPLGLIQFRAIRPRPEPPPVMVVIPGVGLLDPREKSEPMGWFKLDDLPVAIEWGAFEWPSPDP